MRSTLQLPSVWLKPNPFGYWATIALAYESAGGKTVKLFGPYRSVDEVSALARRKKKWSWASFIQSPSEEPYILLGDAKSTSIYPSSVSFQVAARAYLSSLYGGPGDTWEVLPFEEAYTIASTRRGHADRSFIYALREIFAERLVEDFRKKK